jgi:hypothetical protein
MGESASSFNEVSTMMFGGMMGWGMGLGMLLATVVVFLVIAALLKYLFWSK